MAKNKPETAETAVVVPDNGGLPVGFQMAPKLLGGLEQFDPSQLGIRPREMKICGVKRRRTDVGEPGQVRIDRDVHDSVRVVFISAGNFRVLNEGEGANMKTICASADGLVPHDGVAEPKAKACMTMTRQPVCHYAQWTDGPTGKRIPPPCREGIALIGMEHEHPERPPFWLALRGTAAGQARDLLRAMNDAGGAEHLCQFVVTVTGKEMRNQGVVWQVPEFELDEELLPIKQYLRLADAVKDMHYVPRVSPTAAVKEPVDPDLPTGDDGDSPIPF